MRTCGYVIKERELIVKLYRIEVLCRCHHKKKIIVVIFFLGAKILKFQIHVKT